MNWNRKDIDKLAQKGMVKNTPPKKKIKIKKEKSQGIVHIENTLYLLKKRGIINNFVEEHLFHHKRKFRFDFAIPELKLAIEYEGVFSKKSRHTTLKGYTTDCEKYNLAVTCGWKVLRYTATNFDNVYSDIEKFKEYLNKNC